MTNTLMDPLGLDDSALRTGTLLEPLFTWQGTAFYPVFGAEGDDDSDADPDGDSDDDDEDDDTGEGEDKGDKERPVTRDEFERLRKQLSASDKNRAAAEKKLKDIEDAKKDELTKATERADELEKARAKDAATISELRLQNAFLMADTGITWHDPSDALALAERKGYLKDVVDDDGEVDEKKLAAKLKELAAAKPHLVKEAGEDDGKGKSKESPRPTGQKVGSGKKKQDSNEPDLSRYDRLLNR